MPFSINISRYLTVGIKTSENVKTKKKNNSFHAFMCVGQTNTCSPLRSQKKKAEIVGRTF